jgi:hypothetical protein
VKLCFESIAATLASGTVLVPFMTALQQLGDGHQLECEQRHLRHRLPGRVELHAELRFPSWRLYDCLRRRWLPIQHPLFSSSRNGGKLLLAGHFDSQTLFASSRGSCSGRRLRPPTLLVGILAGPNADLGDRVTFDLPNGPSGFSIVSQAMSGSAQFLFCTGQMLANVPIPGPQSSGPSVPMHRSPPTKHRPPAAKHSEPFVDELQPTVQATRMTARYTPRTCMTPPKDRQGLNQGTSGRRERRTRLGENTSYGRPTTGNSRRIRSSSLRIPANSVWSNDRLAFRRVSHTLKVEEAN